VRSRDIAFVALLAGPAIPGDQVLFAQGERISRAMGVPDDLARRNRQIQTELFQIAQNEKRPALARKRMEALLNQETAAVSPEQAAVTRGQVGGQIAMASSRWFRFVWNYDPKPVLEKLSCPVLALYGSRDLQVPADLDAPVMQRALAGNARAKVVIIEGVNHLFQTAATGSPLEYSQIEETVSPKVLETVREWLASPMEGKP
jgi:pimeloyl-ACP methyl ester carboxylesterase